LQKLFYLIFHKVKCSKLSSKMIKLKEVDHEEKEKVKLKTKTLNFLMVKMKFNKIILLLIKHRWDNEDLQGNLNKEMENLK